MWQAVALQAHLTETFLRGIIPGAETASRAPLAAGVAARVVTNVGVRSRVLGEPSTSVKATTARSVGGVVVKDTETAEFMKLNPEPPRLTLAQRMGVAPAPPVAPSQVQWNGAEQKAIGRGEVLRPCPICCEPFRIGDDAQRTEGRDHIILSCSHVFHASCLKQLEKIARQQGLERQCPVCREKHYFKKRHVRGMAQLQVHHISLVQALVRGFLARRSYFRLRMRTNPQFREDKFFQTVRALSDGLLAYAAMREDEVTRVLRDAEEAQAMSAAAMLSEADWRGITETCLRRLIGSKPCEEAAASTDSDTGQDQCTICLQQVVGTSDGDGGTVKACVVTSCGHAFHAACLGSFEAFAKSSSHHQQHAGAPPRQYHCCPLCRQPYVSRPLAIGM
jgi:hypothetical protein